MQRQTPLDNSIRGYQGGGCITCVPTVDDSKGIQESNGSRGMKGENWPQNISPQNYGFTSVIADAIKSGASGAIQQVAEGFMSFMGSNRSFPICSIMDDRRHRLKNLAQDAAKGATAMFGLKEWGQQFLNTDTGMFMTGNTEKKLRFQLVDNQNGQQQQGGGAKGGTRKFRDARSGVEFEIELLADGSGASSGGAGAGESGSAGTTGQKTLHKQDSKTYIDVTKDAMQHVRGNGNMKVEDTAVQTYHQSEQNSTRADDSHVHIHFGGNNIWVDSGGCWSSSPIQIKGCTDQGGGQTGTQTMGPAAHSASAPMSIDNNANISMATSAPIKIASATAEEMAARHAAMLLHQPMPYANGNLFLDIDTTLTITPTGQLSVVGSGGASGVPEAPNDGLMYGRQSLNWNRSLAITGDILDGGNF